MPSSPFDKLRVRTTVGHGSHKILILSLSKDEDFHPLRRPHSTLSRPKKKGGGSGPPPSSISAEAEA
jgi:hypothetical protein